MPTLKHVIRHIGAFHAQDADFNICCGISGCPRTYQKFHSYRQHIYRCHREILDGIDDDQSQGSPVTIEEPLIEDLDCTISESEVPDSYENSHTILSKKEAGLFLIKTKEIYKVPQSTLDSLVGDISTIVESTIKHIEKRVKMELEERGISVTKELQEIFNFPHINKVFQGLHTEFLQKKFLRENYNFVVSLCLCAKR